MSSQAIVDNWSLQHVTEILSVGVSQDHASVIAVSEDAHRYDSIPEAAVQTEALFELLTLIVLKDELFVDEKFTSAWAALDTPLLDLYRRKLLRPVPFTSQEEHYSELRAHLVDKLCMTSSLRQEQVENETSWSESRSLVNPYLSSVLWGGAGMLARSHYFQTPYNPHPLRRRLFVEAEILPSGTRAIDRLQEVVRSKRLDIFKGTANEDSLLALHATLPPIPIQIIAESSSPSKFIETAIALRDEYRTLRAWLAEAEAAVHQGDTKSIKRIEDTLSKIGTSGFGDFFSSDTDTSISIGFGDLSFTIPVNPTAARNLFGVRAIMNRMVFGGSSQNGLSRYCRLMGIEGSALEHKLIEHFGRTEQSRPGDG